MTDVAHTSEPTPHAPAPIKEMLDKLGVSYREVNSTMGLSSNAQRVQAVLLDDSTGVLMVLFPQNQLLDLNRLSELTGRTLTVMKPERLSQALHKHELKVLPGLPTLSSSPCLYDERLLKEPNLLLESGEEDVLLEVSVDDFRRLLAEANPGRFGEPLLDIQPNQTRPEADDAEITRAVTHFTARRIKQRLDETLEIPPLSKTAEKIIKLRVNPEATVDDLAGVVETDPALAAQVISWASSPYYAAPGKIRSVEDAIIRVLGFDLVINLALGLTLGKTITLPKDKPQSATPYWKQSIFTAAVIEGLARAMPRKVRPEMGIAYLCGLLHNFGYLVLAHVFPPHFSLICRHVEANPHLDSSLIERHLIGITREQIGAWLMRNWEMPEELVAALRFQAYPAYDGPNATYANLTFMAVQLLRAEGIGSGPARPIPPELYERLGLTPEKAQECLSRIMGAEAALRELASQLPQ
ncbi:aminoacyl-tRNA deacylase and HDOD domain-containing protein [Pseudomonas sp.]|uniref:aminoacyl-tRNA deacylase and HDOD domain-containing protein n=1 Tax=Pseudomonas sp. TaxID=306 RepID=UPI0028B0CD8C|nr:aminoacyl-tRNA deacylase and HDOD domain-containing protein [Pseudomonas sp.]